VEDLEALTERIESSEGRAQLLSEIRALIALQAQKTQPVTESPFSERLGGTVAEAVEKTSRALSWLDRTLPDRAVLSDWFQNIIRHPETIVPLSRQAMPIAWILSMAWISEFIVERLLKRFRKRIEGRAGRDGRVHFGLAFSRAALRLCALSVFTIVFIIAFFFLKPVPVTGNITVQIFTVYISGRATLIFIRLVLAPSIPSLRLVSLGTESALEWFTWIRRLVTVALAGYLLTVTALLFGLPARGGAFLTDLLGMVLLTMLIVCILRNRKTMTVWILGVEETISPLSLSRHFRNRLAAVWHILAILYLIGAFVVWWRDIEGGFLLKMRLPSEMWLRWQESVVCWKTFPSGPFVFGICPAMSTPFPSAQWTRSPT
jgi:small conductance mechanosensitive channel